MKKLMLIILLLLPLCLGLTLAEDGESLIYSDGSWEYRLMSDGTIEILYHLGKEPHVTIPAMLDGRIVSAVGDMAFIYESTLESVTIPDSVTSIEVSAFDECPSLTTFHVSPDHPVYAAIDGVLFNKLEKRLELYPMGLKATSYTVPQGIRVIGRSAFDNAVTLTSVTLPDSVVSIEGGAFSYCASLTSINLPETLVSIGDSVFFCCTALQSIDLPDSLIFIGSYAFMECSSLTSLTFPGSVPILQDHTFGHCASLESVTIGEGVSVVGESAFWDCPSLRSVTLPDSLTSIGEGVFNECPALEHIAVSPGHPAFAFVDGALYDTAERRLLLVPAGLNPTELVVAGGTASIAPLAISSVSTLTSLILPDTLTAIERYGVFDCDALTSVVLPASVASIGNWVLSSCPNLHSITLLGDIPSIGYGAFSYNSPDLTVTVPRDSSARQWCIDNAVRYTYPDADSWLLD